MTFSSKPQVAEQQLSFEESAGPVHEVTDEKIRTATDFSQICREKASQL